MPFDYTSGNPDNLVGGGPARMQDVQGPFYDIRAWLNSQAGGGSGGGGGLPVLTDAQVLDVGLLNQRRAGRQLTNADFTSLGLSVPIALWNLGDLTDVSGNGRVLANKGAVPFGVGINGFATTCAVFAGSTGQALYISDAGAADPFRIRTGSWGCWFRTAKRGVVQHLISRLNTGATSRSYELLITSTNNAGALAFVDPATTAASPTGTSDVADDRWHFAVATFDGSTCRVYVDGVLEATSAVTGALNPSTGPLNLGAYGADGATAAGNPNYGRVDEAFVTADVLSDDQVRCLYAAKLTHTLARTPTGVLLNVHRKRRGVAYVAADFTTQPLRLHNFTAGALTDEGSGGQVLTNNGAAVTVAGADGSLGNAFSFAGAQSLSATDAGLPAGVTARSYGCWFKTTSIADGGLVAYGTITTGETMLYIRGAAPSGQINVFDGVNFTNGPFVPDGQWHFVVAVIDNAAGDGVRVKLYLDGRLVASNTALQGTTLAGANRLRIGARADGTLPFTGQIDGVFICGYAMDTGEVMRLYAKGAQDLGVSPKNAGDHVERVDASSVLFIGDTLDSQHTVDLGVVG